MLSVFYKSIISKFSLSIPFINTYSLSDKMSPCSTVRRSGYRGSCGAVRTAHTRSSTNCGGFGGVVRCGVSRSCYGRIRSGCDGSAWRSCYRACSSSRLFTVFLRTRHRAQQQCRHSRSTNNKSYASIGSLHSYDHTFRDLRLPVAYRDMVCLGLSAIFFTILQDRRAYADLVSRRTWLSLALRPSTLHLLCALVKVINVEKFDYFLK